MKIKPLTGKSAQIPLDKRQHVPVHVEDDCPKCGTAHFIDLSQGGGKHGHYLGYPTTNVPEPLYFCCEKCEHEWQHKVIVRMTLEAT